MCSPLAVDLKSVAQRGIPNPARASAALLLDMSASKKADFFEKSAF
jgi:hypothetical protein